VVLVGFKSLPCARNPPLSGTPWHSQISSQSSPHERSRRRIAPPRRSRRHGPISSPTCRPRASADAQGEKLRETAESGKEKVSGRWNELQQSWNAHIAGIRADIDARQERHDRAQAERDAEFAEDDAAYAIDYAYAAVEEADYAVPQAELARMDADALEASAAA
jgi:hypothetical protein